MTEILMRNVKLRTSLAGPMGSAGPGAVVSVDSTVARLLVEREAAVYSDLAPTVALAASAAPPPQPGRYDLWSHSPYRAACERRDEFGRLLVAARQRRGHAEVLLAAAAEARQTSLAREADLLLDGDGGGMHAARAKAAAAMKDAEQAEQAAVEAEHEEAVLLAALDRFDGQIDRLRVEARTVMAGQARADHEAAMRKFIEAAVAIGEAHSALLAIQDDAIGSLGDSGGQIRAIRWAGLGLASDPNSILSAWLKDLRSAGYDLNLREVLGDVH